MFLLVSWIPVSGLPEGGKSCDDKLTAWGLKSEKSESTYTILHPAALYDEHWDTLPQATFWRQVMKLHPDTLLINTASGRLPLGKIALCDWKLKSEEEKRSFKADLKNTYNLDSNQTINFTSGKSHFYKFAEVIPEIDKAIKIFERESTDPFFAQAILLIESPARMQKSTAGAYGPFQLMKSVGKYMGLKINKKVDERANFDRAAWAAAKLIRTVCIPYTNKMLDARGIVYKPEDMWYRLLVMHVYHAGAGNVAPVLDALSAKEGGQQLIQNIWQTKCGHFGNSSQNYSQLVIAAMLELEFLVYSNSTKVVVR